MRAQFIVTKKDGACRFYRNVLRSETGNLEGNLTSFEEQKDTVVFSHLG